MSAGDIPEFTAVCEEAREQASLPMEGHAQEIGADAIIGVRYDATEFMQQCTEALDLRDCGQAPTRTETSTP